MRDKIRSQSSTAIRQAISLSYVLIEPRRADWKTWIATLLTSLGLANGLWFAGTADITQIAQAQSVNNISIERQPNETYESLVKRAEAAARAAVTNNVAPNRGTSDDVSITVVAHDRGAIAPVLNLKVSRTDQFSPNVGGEITYFEQARSLLRLEEDLATTTSPATRRVRSRNTDREVQTRNNSSTPSNPPQNLNPGNVKRGFGSNSGNFSQPGRVVTPSSAQPTSNFPSGQTGTTNVPTGQTSPTGTGLTPQSPSTPLNTPSQLPNSTQPTGTGLTPQAPITPPVAPQSQPLSPSTPNSSNSSNTNSTSGTTPSSSSSTTTTPGIVPSSR